MHKVGPSANIRTIHSGSGFKMRKSPASRTYACDSVCKGWPPFMTLLKFARSYEHRVSPSDFPGRRAYLDPILVGETEPVQVGDISRFVILRHDSTRCGPSLDQDDSSAMTVAFLDQLASYLHSEPMRVDQKWITHSSGHRHTSHVLLNSSGSTEGGNMTNVRTYPGANPRAYPIRLRTGDDMKLIGRLSMSLGHRPLCHR